ncbi:cytosine deaminase [Microbacterium terrae]|uniref:N-isopropylammelide isopropyl amidohydrolase n=1 Tax=Microbacterium terrae TaxID=69369 RepID=A0A0M2HJ93_9MICO|nr:amidohydrolase family protein [Microbacterium terrae]KJL44898.1 N-isopropylammelide isopropyl amidohydrolase [Microbacterium terrae]MBP1076766.1 cytosine deaminase [Microbacterium terrae]GLJ97597.1 cytosine deaminase [Microbacterium terrae]
MLHTSFPRISAVRNARLDDLAGTHDLQLDAAGTIVDILPAAGGTVAAGELDARGHLVLPGLVNAHAHVDKSWIGHPWQSYGGDGGTDGRIRHERARRDELGIPGLDITRRVLAAFVASGTTAIRTHVDVDLGLGLRGIDIVREAVAEYDGAITAEIVAFPQDGVLRRPGVIELLRQAAEQGVEHIGGLDPASIDRDPVGQLDALFAIAADTGAGIDIHLHDPAELGAFQFDLILDRTESLGLVGRVNIAHGFAIAQVDTARRRDLLQRMADLDVTMTTVAPLRLPQLPLHEMDAAGVRFAFGTDGIRDLWSPYGTGDLLGIAWQYARSSSVVRDDDLRRVVEIATAGAAPFAGIGAAGIAPGARADLMIVDAENAMDVLVRTPARSAVLGGGRLLFEA